MRCQTTFRLALLGRPDWGAIEIDAHALFFDSAIERNRLVGSVAGTRTENRSDLSGIERFLFQQGLHEQFELVPVLAHHPDRAAE